jgi:FAD/FMN-containing dehydrogenase
VYSEAAGIARLMPAAVAVAANAGDVAALVRWAAAMRLPITPRGSGSSMAGGALGPGVILDLSRLRTLDEVDVESRTVACEAGVLRDEVDAAARRNRLRFPVDPSSGAFCTIGGMVATNAAGAHSLRFGATRTWVNALDCVFADGTSVTLRRGEPPPDLPITRAAIAALERSRESGSAFRRRVRKNSSGYAVGSWLDSGDLLDVMVGSEGTLAIVTRVELRLAPIAGATTSLLAVFPDLSSAAAAAQAAREAGAAACELLDATFLEMVQETPALPGLPRHTEGVLLTALEAADRDSAREKADALERAFAAAGATATTLALVETAERELWEMRHAASPALARLDPALRSVQVIEDGAVPPESLDEYVLALRGALERARAPGVIFGHAGDAHVHVNPLVDVTRPGWRAELDALLDEVTAVVARLGGTLSGEHGDGRLRAPLIGRVWPEDAVRGFRELKAAFDPAGILNPGVKLPLAGQRPLEDVKYDPGLPALPAVAREALDRVAAERAYATSRLSLLGGAS